MHRDFFEEVSQYQKIFDGERDNCFGTIHLGKREIILLPSVSDDVVRIDNNCIKNDCMRTPHDAIFLEGFTHFWNINRINNSSWFGGRCGNYMMEIDESEQLKWHRVLLPDALEDASIRACYGREDVLNEIDLPLHHYLAYINDHESIVAD